VLTLSFGLLWVLFLLPQKRQVRAHQQLVADLKEGDEVVMTAGIHGRITHLGPDDARLEVAPGVELRIARQAVLRRVEAATPIVPTDDADDGFDGEADGIDDDVDDIDDIDGAVEPPDTPGPTGSLEQNETPDPPAGNRV
jgi:preprotein translocase subunit YajC